MGGILTRVHWSGKVAGNADAITERLLQDFPVGSRVAISATVGTWSHELNVEKVSRISKEADDHIVFVTDRYVRGLRDGDFVVFDCDYKGKRLRVATRNFMNPPEPIEWLFVAIEEGER